MPVAYEPDDLPRQVDPGLGSEAERAQRLVQALFAEAESELGGPDVEEFSKIWGKVSRPYGL